MGWSKVGSLLTSFVKKSGDTMSGGLTIVTNDAYSSLIIDSDSSVNGRGAEIALVDTRAGAIPNKFLRNNNGHLQLINSTYSTVILDIDDEGNLEVLSTISDPSGRVYSPGNLPPANANNAVMSFMGAW